MGQESKTKDGLTLVDRSCPVDEPAKDLKRDSINQTYPVMSKVERDQSEGLPENWNTNFYRLLIYQVGLRIGWIFKTETVIMPAVLDLISGSAWIRGFLPVFNRFGQSIPPLLTSNFLATRRQKKRVLFATSLSMAICFAIFSLLIGFRDSISNSLIVWVFLIVYAVFFSCVGLNQAALNTLHGKLLPAKKRGRFMVFSSTCGVAAAVSCAVFLLPSLLQKDADAFHLIFGISASLFFVASIISLWLIEPEDHFPSMRTHFWKRVPEAIGILGTDKEFRLFIVVAAIFGSSIAILPHYQSLAKVSGSFSYSWLLPWLVAQNVGSALFGVSFGFLADKYGNRLALRVGLLIQSTIPLVALLSSAVFQNVCLAFIAVFFMLGNTPVLFRLCNNFTLESTGVQSHPKYLGAQAACISLPCVLLSVPVGFLVDQIGYVLVFAGQAFVLFLGFLLTFRISEPRQSKALNEANL